MVKFGAYIARKCEPPIIIYLQGTLGMGKTTLVRGFLHAMGYDGFVKSPTFTLVESYPFSDHEVYHFDLYRVAGPEELAYIGLRDYLTDSSICLFEWPEKGEDELPEPDISIHIEQHNSGRRLTVEWRGSME